MRHFKNFLFDWDGTLVNSPSLHDKAFRKVIGKIKPDILATFDYSKFHGYTTRDVFYQLGFTVPEECQALTKEKQLQYRQMVETGELGLYPGVSELLSFLKNRGDQIYLVTGGSRISVETGLRVTGVADCFSGLITADDVVRGKPDPESYLQCLQRFQLPKDHAIVIEDAPSGVLAARAAGLPSIGVHEPEIRFSCDFWFPSITDFLLELKKQEVTP